MPFIIYLHASRLQDIFFDISYQRGPFLIEVNWQCILSGSAAQLKSIGWMTNKGESLN